MNVEKRGIEKYNSKEGQRKSKTKKIHLKKIKR